MNNTANYKNNTHPCKMSFSNIKRIRKRHDKLNYQQLYS